MKSLNETNNLTIQLNSTLIHLEKSNSLINNLSINVNEYKEKYKNIFKIEKVRFKSSIDVNNRNNSKKKNSDFFFKDT